MKTFRQFKEEIDRTPLVKQPNLQGLPELPTPQTRIDSQFIQKLIDGPNSFQMIKNLGRENYHVLQSALEEALKIEPDKNKKRRLETLLKELSTVRNNYF